MCSFCVLNHQQWAVFPSVAPSPKQEGNRMSGARDAGCISVVATCSKGFDVRLNLFVILHFSLGEFYRSLATTFSKSFCSATLILIYSYAFLYTLVAYRHKLLSKQYFSRFSDTFDKSFLPDQNPPKISPPFAYEIPGMFLDVCVCVCASLPGTVCVITSRKDDSVGLCSDTALITKFCCFSVATNLRRDFAIPSQIFIIYLRNSVNT